VIAGAAADRAPPQSRRRSRWSPSPDGGDHREGPLRQVLEAHDQIVVLIRRRQVPRPALPMAMARSAAQRPRRRTAGCRRSSVARRSISGSQARSGRWGMAGRSDQPAKRRDDNGMAAAEAVVAHAGCRDAGASAGVVQLSPVGGACPAVEAGCPAGMASAPAAVIGSIVWASWPPPICTRRGLAASATGIVSVSTPCS
jgi:hypothetical protein